MIQHIRAQLAVDHRRRVHDQRPGVRPRHRIEHVDRRIRERSHERPERRQPEFGARLECGDPQHPRDLGVRARVPRRDRHEDRTLLARGHLDRSRGDVHADVRAAALHARVRECEGSRTARDATQRAHHRGLAHHGRARDGAHLGAGARADLHDQVPLCRVAAGIGHPHPHRDVTVGGIRVRVAQREAAIARDEHAHRILSIHRAGALEHHRVTLGVHPALEPRQHERAARRELRTRPLPLAALDRAPLRGGVRVGVGDRQRDGRRFGDVHAVRDPVRERRRSDRLRSRMDHDRLAVGQQRHRAELGCQIVAETVGHDRQHVLAVRVVVVEQHGQLSRLARAHAERVGDRDRRLLLGRVGDHDGAAAFLGRLDERPLLDRDQASLRQRPHHARALLREQPARAVRAEHRIGLPRQLDRAVEIERPQPLGRRPQARAARAEPGGIAIRPHLHRLRRHPGRLGDALGTLLRHAPQTGSICDERLRARPARTFGTPRARTGRTRARRARCLQHGVADDPELDRPPRILTPQPARLGVEQHPVARHDRELGPLSHGGRRLLRLRETAELHVVPAQFAGLRREHHETPVRVERGRVRREPRSRGVVGRGIGLTAPPVAGVALGRIG